MRFTFLVITLCIVFLRFPVFATEVNWQAIRTGYLENHMDYSLERLNAIEDEYVNQDVVGMKYFALGKIHYEQNDIDQAEKEFLATITHKARTRGYAHFFLGEIYFNKGDYQKAVYHLNHSIAEKISRDRIRLANWYKAQIAFKKGQYKTAYNGFLYVERNWRGEAEHPQAMWEIMRTELARRRFWKACFWMRKIYSRYPEYEKAKEWKMDLTKVEVDGLKPRCDAPLGQKIRRIKRWAFVGHPERALNEIQEMKISRREGDAYQKDILLTHYQLSQGFVKESLALMVPYYKDKNKDNEYLNLMARITSNMGLENETVGIYYRAFELYRHNKRGRKALFHAAFQAYRYQDYDVALNYFTKFLQLYGNSGLARDSRWYRGWIRYLRGDYQGAVADLGWIKRQKERRWGRRRWAQHSMDKINYWLAKSYLNMGQIEKGKDLLENIQSQSNDGFFKLLALQNVEHLKKLKMDSTDFLRQVATVQLNDEVLVEGDESQPETDVLSEEEQESEQTLVQEDEDLEGLYNKILIEKENGEEAEEFDFVTNFKDPRLGFRFDRAKEFLVLGFHEMAKWELYEVERRTSNSAYLKTLMGSYQAIKSYNRSSYVSEIYFSADRQKYGVKGIRYLWEYAYPRAYQEVVVEEAKNFGVPQEFIWSIMLAESRFKSDIVSPVGARGLMQIMPFTAERIAKLMGEEEFDADKLFDPHHNVRFGTRYLKRLSKQFQNMWALVAAGYNAGPHRVETWLREFGALYMDEFIEHIPYLETRNYVKKVIKNLSVYNQLYADTKMNFDWLLQPVPIKPKLDPVLREDWTDL